MSRKVAHVALVTDSTAELPPEVATKHDITVIPLQVVIGARSYDEGVEGGATPELLANALADWTPVSTSRPNPDEFLEIYEKVAKTGVKEIVSVHLSSELSGTFESAAMAARRASIPVTVIDSRQVGMGIGFAVVAGAEARAEGADARAIATVIRTRCAAITSLFYVDTLEYLRRGGRVSAAAALFGSALAVKPILTVSEGKVGPLERVRTAGKALARLEELAVKAAGDVEVDIAVAHLASPDRAAHLAAKLNERVAEGLGGRAVQVGEIGAVLGAHVGPGMVAVTVARR